MIRNETEYKQAVERLRAERSRLDEQEIRLKETGLGPAEIKRVLDPMRSFHAQLVEEVEHYEQLKRGEFGELHNLGGLGQLLVMLRIAQGMTQNTLAEKLGVDPSQVSRDERNEYRNITLERASRILEALGAQITSTVETPLKRPAA